MLKVWELDGLKLLSERYVFFRSIREVKFNGL